MTMGLPYRYGPELPFELFVLRHHDIMPRGSAITAGEMLTRAIIKLEDDLQLVANLRRDKFINWFIKCIERDLRRHRFAIDLINLRLTRG